MRGFVRRRCSCRTAPRAPERPVAALKVEPSASPRRTFLYAFFWGFWRVYPGFPGHLTSSGLAHRVSPGFVGLASSPLAWPMTPSAGKSRTTLTCMLDDGQVARDSHQCVHLDAAADHEDVGLDLFDRIVIVDRGVAHAPWRRRVLDLGDLLGEVGVESMYLDGLGIERELGRGRLAREESPVNEEPLHDVRWAIGRRLPGD